MIKTLHSAERQSVLRPTVCTIWPRSTPPAFRPGGRSRGHSARGAPEGRRDRRPGRSVFCVDPVVAARSALRPRDVRSAAIGPDTAARVRTFEHNDAALGDEGATLR